MLEPSLFPKRLFRSTAKLFSLGFIIAVINKHPRPLQNFLNKQADSNLRRSRYLSDIDCFTSKPNVSCNLLQHYSMPDLALFSHLTRFLIETRFVSIRKGHEL